LPTVVAPELDGILKLDRKPGIPLVRGPAAEGEEDRVLGISDTGRTGGEARMRA
jgi:hypothetical protein